MLACRPVSFSAQAPAKSPYYARRNSIGILAAYSPSSSHIVLGFAEKRKLVNLGISYSRRLLLTRHLEWLYDGEFLPVALEGDPLEVFVNQQTSPTPVTYSGSLPYSPVTCTPVSITYSTTFNGITYSGTQTDFCSGRQWTYGEAISPIGMQWNFLPRRKIQPLVAGHGGYMFSTHPIPIAGAGSFNFTFDLDAGIEIFRTSSQSIRAEYRYHHISNHNTANQNPGIDSGLFQVSYCFGR